MAQMKYTAIEEMEDKHLGKIGTPKRDAFGRKLERRYRATTSAKR